MALRLFGKNFSLPRALLAHVGLATTLRLPRTISPSEPDSVRNEFTLNDRNTNFRQGKCADDVSMRIIGVLWKKLQGIEPAMSAGKWDLIE